MNATASQLMTILNGLTAAVLLVDQDRCIVATNAAAEDIFGTGYKGQDLVQAIRHPDCLRAVDEVLAGANRVQAEITLQRPVVATYRMTVSRLPDADVEPGALPARAVLSLDNISHVLEAEQMRSDFVANVSHELRSPLTALNGFIETLKGAARDDEEARNRFLAIMEREAHRMNRLIGDLLSLSRVEANKYIRPTGSVDIVQTINQVITTLGDRAKTEKKVIVLNLPEKDATLIPGDEDQISQVFLNLIENAIKYGRPDTDVTIDIAVLETSPGIRGQALRVDVRDEGAGIPAEHLPRLTERFYRVDDSRSREKGGTGLGLAIVKHIIGRHRGRLKINSIEGEGSTFSVFLPASLDTI